MATKKNLKLIIPIVLITFLFGLGFIQLLPSETAQTTEQPVVMDDFVAMKTIAVLAFVFLLLGLFGWLAKTYFSPLSGFKNNGRMLKIIESLPVSPKSRIVLVDVANEKLVLGVTEHNITVLTEIEDVQKQEKSLPDAPPQHRFLSHIKALSKTSS
ncbi:MAG: flagellar biosynthetic protein FliO [Calditrichaeota bacterium]|nr:MAG: flagellar biosynthetic protein FliO [Calditrichota bacterium]